ncbi:DUF6090 family protein [Balneola sp. MJW-20]|uniref:DUF6090 family protein n=1 Tax=Gracilimonas aurantiaca TaxID=3234185 RepID=UPI0034655239
MIQFLRKIRQTLVMENKTGKYFKYAIGEIVLVVIGILIALQINNWNEERKARVEERELLTNLSVSFTNKLAELEDKNAGRIENIENINRLLHDISRGELSYSEGDMTQVIGRLYTWFTVNEEFSVIDMLFSSGRINTISNDTLKSQLISWPDQMEEMFEEQRVIQDLVVSRLNPLIAQYYSYANMVMASDSSYTGSPNPNDLNALLKDRDFEGLISRKKIYLMTNINDTNILIDNARSILGLIEEELNRN